MSHIATRCTQATRSSSAPNGLGWLARILSLAPCRIRLRTMRRFACHVIHSIRKQDSPPTFFVYGSGLPRHPRLKNPTASTELGGPAQNENSGPREVYANGGAAMSADPQKLTHQSDIHTCLVYPSCKSSRGGDDSLSSRYFVKSSWIKFLSSRIASRSV